MEPITRLVHDIMGKLGQSQYEASSETLARREATGDQLELLHDITEALENLQIAQEHLDSAKELDPSGYAAHYDLQSDIDLSLIRRGLEDWKDEAAAEVEI